MERLGLDRFFPAGQGAFGCESADRVELIGLALDRARVSPDAAVEIGDTNLDEETARAAGIRSIRVDRLSSFAELLELVA
jgi:phosphoglycolate phosphatase-like HAD superfamily hydrolase